MKTCSKCRIEKSEDSFTRGKRWKDGLFPQCRKCKAAGDKKYREENYKELAAKGLVRRNKNKDKKRVYDKRYTLMNAERIKKRRATDYTKNKERADAENAKRYARNPEPAKARSREYQKANRIELNMKQASRRESDIGFRILTGLRKRLNKAMCGKTKSASTRELVGCSIPYLRDWLAWQFSPGMGWCNYGQWHIDHIKPCASFDLTDPAQQRECFHFQNLQPLWAKDNIKKGKSWDISLKITVDRTS